MSGRIAAYLYGAELYTRGGVIEPLIGDGIASPAARGMDVEELLDQIANANAIDRTDETSFDSSEFPKIVLEEDLEPGEILTGAIGYYTLGGFINGIPFYDMAL